jgi:CheY-like chemotaxis protein
MLITFGVRIRPGDEVPRRLRDKPATAGIPVAILSAEAGPAVIRRLP